MQIINNWLNGRRDFYVGRVMYEVFGLNQSLKALLKKGRTPFAEKEMYKALEALANSGGPVKPPVKPANKDVAVMDDSKDAVLQSLKNEWMPLYQRMNLLRHELDKYGDRNDWEATAWRKPRASEIKELEQQINQLWDKADHYHKHGRLPFVQEKKVDIPTDPVKLGKMIESIKKNIRRNRDRMSKHPERSEFTQRYEDYKKQFKELTGKEYVEKN